jgi:small subunit ribosomal protein S16
MDQRSPRDGRSIEELGFYDPIEKDDAKAIKLDGERIKYWLEQGAQPTDTVVMLCRKAGVLESKKQVV